MSLKNCRLCAGELFASPLIRLDDMPKAAQHFPEKSEFSTDRGITLPVRQCVACGLVQLDREPVDYFRDVITAATLPQNPAPPDWYRCRHSPKSLAWRAKKS